MIIPENLRLLRKAHKVTQKELAHTMKVSINYISMIENGEYKYGDEECKKYVNGIFKTNFNKLKKEVYKNNK